VTDAWASPAAASTSIIRSCSARATKTEVIAAVVIERNAIPYNMMNDVRILPTASLGVTSP
jgi:hypothetical protein